ncbi:heme lyase CcmF/NrfE family subunit [Paenibacillus athensensis]|uniref:Cytochrome C biogenesis protein n=1 Tax=Paenibacillus athensensis TaxID=1967502 RepID=A0A4Y8Q2W4_9BACL|nr:heme lyase CcmF/NrfE family subunit [Paenibacillus athensensis]MCD1261053.1 heme lyase CcmF/NrfE family subunit [Paenibacillus athensensis]
MEMLGKALFYAAWALAVYSFAALAFGAWRSKPQLVQSGFRGLTALFGLVLVIAGMIWYLLGTSDFRFEFVVNYTTRDLQLPYKLAAFWAGNAGSLTLWLLILCAYAMLVQYARSLRGNPMVPIVMAILALNMIFFLTLLGFVDSPFQVLDVVPKEGRGLNPQLQNPAMLIHPVMLYHGYVGMVVPFAFGIAALILKRADGFWIKATRRWTMIAWLFLTAGNVLGGAWAYVELGWGGYWAWDPVENASFMPWLTATAFLHSAMIQERKDMLKVWNISLIIVTYGLTLFGTFLVRSGVLTSVHAFGDSDLGMYFLVFIGIMTIGAVYVLFKRYSLLTQGGEFRSFLSKESSFLFNNLLLVGATFAVFWGTVFPLVSEAVRGTTVTVGEPYYNHVVAPMLLGVLFLMGIGPLIAWQRSSLAHLRQNFLLPFLLANGVALVFYLMDMRNNWALLTSGVLVFVVMTHYIDFARGVRARMQMTRESFVVSMYRLVVRNRRRYGGYLVHMGIVMIAVGIVGSQQFAKEKLETLKPGQQITVGPYVLTYQQVKQKKVNANDVVYADLSVHKAGGGTDTIEPEKVFYPTFEKPSTEVAILSSFENDLYVVLNSWEEDGRATFMIKVIPLQIWVWIGAVVVLAGGLLAIWGGRFGQKVPKYIEGVGA